MNTQSICSNETVTVVISPYQTARGDLVARGPRVNEATIRIGNRLLHGECLSLVSRRTAAVQSADSASA